MKKVALLDICLPDYFTGYHLPVIAIPVYGTMTYEDMAAEIQNEVNSIGFDFDFTDEDYQLYDNYTNELKQNPSAIFCKVDEIAEDCEDCAYAYFSIINPVTKNGITFLN